MPAVLGLCRLLLAFSSASIWEINASMSFLLHGPPRASQSANALSTMVGLHLTLCLAVYPSFGYDATRRPHVWQHPHLCHWLPPYSKP